MAAAAAAAADDDDGFRAAGTVSSRRKIDVTVQSDRDGQRLSQGGCVVG